jgi:hypothetical protein
MRWPLTLAVLVRITVIQAGSGRWLTQCHGAAFTAAAPWGGIRRQLDRANLRDGRNFDDLHFTWALWFRADFIFYFHAQVTKNVRCLRRVAITDLSACLNCILFSFCHDGVPRCRLWNFLEVCNQLAILV